MRYLALRPHTALEPLPDNVGSSLEQQENEVAWCILLVNRVLALVLPPEDLLNPCLDVLVSEIFSEMIFHNGICGKACEPWLLWDGIAKALQSIRPATGVPLKAQIPAANSLERSGLLSPSHVSTAADHHKPLRSRFDAAVSVFWLAIQCVMTLWFLLRSFSTALMQARSIPNRAPRRLKMIHTQVEPDGVNHLPQPELEKRPIVRMDIWELTSQLLQLDQRMPWLTGMLALLQWAALYGPGQICHTNGILDR